MYWYEHTTRSHSGINPSLGKFNGSGRYAQLFQVDVDELLCKNIAVDNQEYCLSSSSGLRYKLFDKEGGFTRSCGSLEQVDISGGTGWTMNDRIA